MDLVKKEASVEKIESKELRNIQALLDEGTKSDEVDFDFFECEVEDIAFTAGEHRVLPT